jgi:hypothetical protein
VADTFGKEAEALAYNFSILDRPRTLETPGDGNAVHLRFSGGFNTSNEMLRDLQLIEAANLLDQKSLDKWPNLKKVWEL